uniref:furin n=1 Tax=Timema bartmani TaxID=61472 RepID=A0A7R9F268_9NEOP|nr:unnamed protein product [Timema bartmani]
MKGKFSCVFRSSWHDRADVAMSPLVYCPAQGKRRHAQSCQPHEVNLTLPSDRAPPDEVRIPAKCTGFKLFKLILKLTDVYLCCNNIERNVLGQLAVPLSELSKGNCLFPCITYLRDDPCRAVGGGDKGQIHETQGKHPQGGCKMMTPVVDHKFYLGQRYYSSMIQLAMKERQSCRWDPQASYDVNNHDENPMPRYDLLDSNRHGTRCAGEVAATANNTLCAVGVAFGASESRMLDGDVTDAVEARSLSLNPQHIDIYSASWGPDDDGKTVDGPGELATRAFIEGVTRGRSGKGSIFVWASGNGGRDHDNCNCDGYTNSIWTLSISSATEAGRVPWYSEACSSTLATTYSSGSPGEKQVVTTDLHHSCTSGHTGTSASAPLAAGICALALEANKGLTWRDMQHIVVRTAKPANLKSPDWTVNGVGRNVSHSFGYGLMDASAMVKLARIWKTVPEQHKCEVSAPHADKLIPAKSQVILQLNVKECAGVNFLEHVQAKISLASSRRGDLQIHLTSPSGTRSTLLALRPHDISRTGFQSWPFMSVHTWGEQPFGVWQLEIHNEGRYLGQSQEI